MSAIAFTSPLVLLGLLALPLIWWLLRITPPRPEREVFPPLKILASVMKREESPATSPWWLTLLRMLLAALVILALSGPLLNPQSASVSPAGPLVVVIDNGWSTAPDWETRSRTAAALIGEAGEKDITVILVLTAEQRHDTTPMRADQALAKLAAALPRPLKTDRARAVSALVQGLGSTAPGTIAYVSDGLAEKDGDDILARLGGLKPAELRLIAGESRDVVMIASAANGADSMSVVVRRLDASQPASLSLSARDNLGRSIAATRIGFAAGETEARGEIVTPFELRNDFARLELDGRQTAGAVRLLDDSFKRRRVGLLTGEGGDRSQPLLSPLYYIERALAPYANLAKPASSDLAVAIPALLADHPSAIVMADIGRMQPETEKMLLEWIAKGGTLIRFAGPRLATAASDDALIPVRLRQGERYLGGALSWSEPQALSAHPAGSPFAGLDVPADIRVSRQVLAEPSADLAARSWATLVDGTPLVTARREGAGRIVLFHVSAEASWSNLPISGHFVEMLRRMVQMSRTTGPASEAEGGEIALPPYRLLSAKGVLGADLSGAKPLTIGNNRVARISFDNPPGLYGTEDGFSALNLAGPDDRLIPLNAANAPIAMTKAGFIGTEATSLKPGLLLAAFVLLITDTLVVLVMNGAFARRPAIAALAMLAIGLIVLAPAGNVMADDARPGDDVLLSRLNTTHLAYVVTGEAEVDRISERGMAGLSDYLFYRTTLEPAEPVGVDISRDELSVFPILYWPISANAAMPSEATISRIDAYMRSGGTVLFDTRDQLSSMSLDGSISPNTVRLQDILAAIDIPPLEPVPSDHVLTKAFYLLKSFPGRYAGSPLWVEALPDKTETEAGRPARSGDGVTPIMITSNDFAGAWAIDANGAALLPTIPADGDQRDYAYRTGVNIMMYMLTGNYKADQVHVPALLERLGQ